jgi:4-amino-4-deoxy-L-arabinose transferase-like glycosyltransferase
MLIVLTLLSYALLSGVLLGRSRPERWTAILLVEALLLAAAFWAGIVSLSSEILGLFHALNRTAVAVLWAGVAIGVGVLGWNRGHLQAAWSSLRATSISLRASEVVLLVCLAILSLALLAVAWISPPNNVDSLYYHVARVAHWAENQSLEHYATARQNQLLKPIWAETAILHLRLLWGGDRPSNLVQWFSMVLSVIGVAGVAARLGAGRSGRLLAAVFAMTIPAGILQASSTQNDYAVAAWSVYLAFWVVTAKDRELTRWEKVGLGLALGAGFLTKGTFYVYAPPLMLWYFLPRLRTRGIGSVLREGMVLTLIAVLLNLGFWARNVQTYGGPYGTSEWLQTNLWIRFLPSAPRTADETPPGEPEGGAVAIPVPAGASWVDRVARVAAFNMVTPSGRVNDVVRQVMARFPETFPPGYMREYEIVAWSHEDTTPNTIHLVLAVLAVAGAFVTRGPAGPLSRKYGLLVLAMYGLIPVVIGHGTSVWGMRYQLPFFVLAAPVAGVVFASMLRSMLTPYVGGLLLLAALPWVLFNNTRPLIGRTPWPTRVGSILTTSQADLMFAAAPKLQSPYEQAVQAVEAHACQSVGLRIDSGHLEYLFWWLFAAPESGTRIETIYTLPRLEPLLNRDFRPCAVICTICGDRTRLHGLPLVAGLNEGVSVFAGDGFTWDPDA